MFFHFAILKHLRLVKNVKQSWSKNMFSLILMHYYFFLKNRYKRYFRIDQHLARLFINYAAGFSSPPPFLCSHTITQFWNSMISSNQETGLEFQSIMESLRPTPLILFYSRISLTGIFHNFSITYIGLCLFGFNMLW